MFLLGLQETPNTESKISKPRDVIATNNKSFSWSLLAVIVCPIIKMERRKTGIINFNQLISIPGIKNDFDTPHNNGLARINNNKL